MLDGMPRASRAYLLKSPERRYWDATAYVQAHESLHLFGAVDSITAFGVGWVDQQPHPLPFPLQQADTEP